MLRMKETIAIALAAAVGAFGLVAAEARDIKIQKKRVEVQTRAPAPAPVVAEPAKKVEAGQATAAEIVHTPPCARKVKVVYSGYGEASRANCGAEAAETAR